MERLRALSVRQPYAELIMRGGKEIEYRSKPTKIRGLVYIYASMTPGQRQDFERLRLKLGFTRSERPGVVELSLRQRKRERHSLHADERRTCALPLALNLASLFESFRHRAHVFTFFV